MCVLMFFSKLIEVNFGKSAQAGIYCNFCRQEIAYRVFCVFSTKRFYIGLFLRQEITEFVSNSQLFSVKNMLICLLMFFCQLFCQQAFMQKDQRPKMVLAAFGKKAKEGRKSRLERVPQGEFPLLLQWSPSQSSL